MGKAEVGIAFSSCIDVCTCSLQCQSCLLKNPHCVVNPQQKLHFWQWEIVTHGSESSPIEFFFFSLSLSKLFPAVIHNLWIGCFLVNLCHYSIALGNRQVVTREEEELPHASTALSAFHVMTHIILVTALWDRYYCYPYLIEEGTQDQRI